MTQHITPEQAVALARGVYSDSFDWSEAHDLCNAAIQHYIDQRAKELPVLPEPNVPEGDWFVLDCYIKEYAKAYGQQCAAHAREVALEQAT